MMRVASAAESCYPGVCINKICSSIRTSILRSMCQKSRVKTERRPVLFCYETGRRLHTESATKVSVFGLRTSCLPLRWSTACLSIFSLATAVGLSFWVFSVLCTDVRDSPTDPSANPAAPLYILSRLDVAMFILLHPFPRPLESLFPRVSCTCTLILIVSNVHLKPTTPAAAAAAAAAAATIVVLVRY